MKFNGFMFQFLDHQATWRVRALLKEHSQSCKVLSDLIINFGEDKELLPDWNLKSPNSHLTCMSGHGHELFLLYFPSLWKSLIKPEVSDESISIITASNLLRLCFWRVGLANWNRTFSMPYTKLYLLSGVDVTDLIGANRCCFSLQLWMIADRVSEFR